MFGKKSSSGETFDTQAQLIEALDAQVLADAKAMNERLPDGDFVMDAAQRGKVFARTQEWVIKRRRLIGGEDAGDEKGIDLLKENMQLKTEIEELQHKLEQAMAATERTKAKLRTPPGTKAQHRRWAQPDSKIAALVRQAEEQ